MDKKIRVCIADDNKELTLSMAKYLSKNEKIEVVKVCNNGEEVLKVLDEEKIDVLILDIIMPYMDGIGVLEKLNEEKEQNEIPKVIIVSAIAHDSWRLKLLKLGVSYYMIKPLNMNLLIKRIIDVYEDDINIQRQNIEKDILQKLHELAIYPNLIGYNYIKESIQILIERHGFTNNFRENVYSIIAEKNGVREFTIEKAINNAIHTSWSKNKEKIISVFKSKIYSRKAPSARVFITTIAENIMSKEENVV